MASQTTVPTSVLRETRTFVFGLTALMALAVTTSHCSRCAQPAALMLICHLRGRRNSGAVVSRG